MNLKLFSFFKMKCRIWHNFYFFKIHIYSKRVNTCNPLLVISFFFIDRGTIGYSNQ